MGLTPCWSLSFGGSGNIFWLQLTKVLSRRLHRSEKVVAIREVEDSASSSDQHERAPIERQVLAIVARFNLGADFELRQPQGFVLLRA